MRLASMENPKIKLSSQYKEHVLIQVCISTLPGVSLQFDPENLSKVCLVEFLDERPP